MNMAITYKTFSERVVLISGIAAFVGLFQWVYISWLFPVWGYFGFYYNPPGIVYVVLANLLSIIPSIWMPIALTRPSQLIYWALYLVVFIPSIFIPLYAALQPNQSTALFMITLFLGHALIGGNYLFQLPKSRFKPLPVMFIKILLISIFITLTIWVFVVFRGNLRLVSFRDIYKEVRFSANALMEGTSVHYAIMWLGKVINPFLMSWSLTHKGKFLFCIGALGQVFLYSTTGSKSVLLSIIMILIFYSVLRLKITSFGINITFAGVFLLLILNLMNMAATETLMISTLIFMRSFGVPGLLSGQYYDFFQNHPLTYFSHVNIIGKFIDYPYAYDLGHELAGYYYDNYDINANAHFWVTDGIAGGGLLGVLLVSILCAAVFWLLDSAAKGHNIVFVTLLASLSGISLCNASLFITLNSAGLGYIIILLYLMPRNLKAGV